MVTPIALKRRNQRALRRFERLRARVSRGISILAVLRLIAFLIGCICGAASILDHQWLPYGPAGCLALVVFLVVVRLHRKPFALLPRVEQMLANTHLSEARLSNEWGVQDQGIEFADPERPELSELRLFGPGSAFQQLNRTGLESSRRQLAHRLTNGMDAMLIPGHQASIRALLNRTVFRRRMEVESRLLSVSPNALEDALAWAEDSKPAMAYLNRIQALSVVLCIATGIQLFLELWANLQTAWQLTFLGQVLVFALTTGRLGQSYLFMIGDQKTGPLSSLRALFGLCEGMRFETPYLQGLQMRLRAGGPRSMHVELGQFNGIIDRLSVRHGPMLHALLGIGLGWEIHAVASLENWRHRIGSQIRGAVDALTDLELVLCGCGFAEELEQCAYPSILTARPVETPMRFEQVGHPSIPAQQRKYNDFELAESGELALVTGSNMSGKSTFLRTIGINVALAQAGMPVCAESASLSQCRVVSSIQVTDRPEDGLSRFHAEVLRLKGILDAVKCSEPLTFYLIDEMLSGTNSRERGIACRSVLKELHGAPGAFGIVTTHDLDLARATDGPPLAFYHFADRFDGEALHFDYQLRQGIATTTNAIRVLEIEGIAIEH